MYFAFLASPNVLFTKMNHSTKQECDAVPVCVKFGGSNLLDDKMYT